MKFVFAAAALLAVPALAHAQTPPAPAPAPAPAPTPAPAATPAKPTVDSTIEAIAADPKGRAALDAQFAGMLAHESYPSFKGMTLKAVQPYSGGVITDEKIAAVAAELAKR